MARKIIDTYPQITLTVGGEVPKFTSYRMSEAEAYAAKAEFMKLIGTLRRMTKRQFDVDTKIVRKHACEYCGSIWTEPSAEFNGGCCGRDAANDPERLSEFRALAEAIDAEVFYRLEEGQRSRIPIDWPGALAHGIVAWLDNGRSDERGGIDFMLRLAKRVTDAGWCTVWEDPGPSGCSLARMPDQVRMDDRPEQLANDLCSLLDDMGFLPAASGRAT